MGDLLKNVVLGLGIFFGVLKPESAPMLQGRLWRDAERLYLSMEIVNAIHGEIENLILAGNTLRIRAGITLNGEKLPGVYHSITYDLKDCTFTLVLSEHGTAHRTLSKEAAFILLNTFADVPVALIADTTGNVQNTLTITLYLEIPDDIRFDPSVLWNYAEPVKTWRWNRITEIPW